MRGLTAEELYELRMALPESTGIDYPPDDLGDPPIAESLTRRGLLRRWEDDDNCIWWETTSLGRIAIACQLAAQGLT